MKIYSAYLIIIGNLMALAGSILLVCIRWGMKSDLSNHLVLSGIAIICMIAGIFIRNWGMKKRAMGE